MDIGRYVLYVPCASNHMIKVTPSIIRALLRWEHLDVQLRFLRPSHLRDAAWFTPLPTVRTFRCEERDLRMSPGKRDLGPGHITCDA
jgi:hypothetical protein